MAIKIKGKVYVNVREASDESDRSVNTIYQKHREWGWPRYKYGSNLMFLKSDIQKWLDEQVCAVN